VIRFRELTGSQLSDLGVLVREDAVSDEEAGVSDDDALVCASDGHAGPVKSKSQRR
jgi:hypothetical protein